MSKKLKTYLMLLVVAAIWGKIGYDIYANKGPEPELNVFTDKVSTIDTRGNETTGYEIDATYRDPFLGTVAKRKQVLAKSTQKGSRTTPKAQNESKVIWPTISYLGSINNKTSGFKSAILNVNGVEKVLNEKETTSGITLAAIFQDSIRLRKEGVNKTIYR